LSVDIRIRALVPAAGSGARFGHATPKQYLPLAGRPLVAHALTALCTHPRIDGVAVVLSPDDELFDRIDPAPWLGRCDRVRCGGRTRAETVLNGLLAMRGRWSDDDWVLVHDAARPCVSHVLLDRLIDTLSTDPVGGIAAIPLADTVKRADAEQRIAATVPRDGLWAAQTPQMFRLGLLVRALSSGTAAEITDEASAVERLGLRPRLVPGDPANLKVTYPDDLRTAERHLLDRFPEDSTP